MNAQKITIEYNDRVVRRFLLATVIWGAVALLVGVLIAFQLNFWQLNLGLEYLSFGRLRPLHTNAAIFAFVGNMMFAGVYYSTQRLCKARMASDLLSNLHFLLWQLIIVCAAVTLPLGLTRGKEYAELIWPINILVAVVWVIFAINFFWTLARRNEPSLYVALWFYIATIITVAMLYIVNHLSLPTSLTHSYPIFAGVQDALVQWWYGHNAVAFFLTTPILGIMYYFMPKAAGRPVYSYRLSVVHFWSLVFLYIWAGPHHLLNTSLPFWLQGLGMLFSVMLWAPSWGGMLNGLLTLRGAWDKLRTDPVIKFFVVAITFYGMSTFEGPLLSIRSVNALSHYTDWTIGHVHGGTLGWNGFMAAGMIYWLVPRLWKTKLWSENWANMHFWLGLVGILLYVASMWVAGISQGLQLNELDAAGGLKNEFVQTLNSQKMMYLTRATGGTLYLVGFIMLVINVFKSIAGKEANDGAVEVVSEKTAPENRLGAVSGAFGQPAFISIVAIVGYCVWFLAYKSPALGWLGLIVGLVASLMAVKMFIANKSGWTSWHDKLLENWVPFTIVAFIAVIIGGMVQIIPTVIMAKDKNVTDRLQVPYTPLELAGRDIYIQEGCYNCHSQMIRMLKPDVLRYGRPGVADDFSRLGESIYDHPFQWGSKRTGPDLAREGARRGNDWHYKHFINPREMSPGSIMPAYSWLAEKETNIKALPGKISALTRLGVAYKAMSRDEIEQGAIEEGIKIANSLKTAGINVAPTKQVVALIAFMQRLGIPEKGFVDVNPASAPTVASSPAPTPAAPTPTPAAPTPAAPTPAAPTPAAPTPTPAAPTNPN